MESWIWFLAGGAALALTIAGYIRFKTGGMQNKRQIVAKQNPEKEMAVIKNICRNKLLRSGSDNLADKS